MLKRALSALFLLSLIVVTIAPQALISRATGLQQTRTRTFPATGHSAVSPFLEYWERTPNATFVLGYPISQPFVQQSFSDPSKSFRVQYFERAVLEEHPENLGTDFYVQGRLMGRLLAQGRDNEPPFQPVSDPGDGTWNAVTQHTLRNEPAPFRSFWETNGGLDVFGYPISEQFQEVNQADGQTYWVQYFERQRVEWHPNDPGAQIKLGLLGNEFRDRYFAGNACFDPNGTCGDNVAGPPTPIAAPTSPVTTPTPAPRTSPFIYGYNAHLFGQFTDWQDRTRVLDLSKQSGIYWIRQQVRWVTIEPARGAYDWRALDALVDDANAAGVNLFISVVNSPSWATSNGSNGMPSRANFGAFARFMGEMAARYRGKVQAYQVWNEPNLAHENGGTVANADYYVDMLAVAYDAIKAADPSAIVVSGSTSPTETNRPDVAVSDVLYTQQMLSNPNFRADVVGAHPGGQHNPPDTLWPENPGPYPQWQNSREFYFRRIEDIRQAMIDAGRGDMKIWMTEFGWATANNTPGYEYGNNNSFEQQAEYIRRAFEKGRYEYSPWLEAMFLWNLNFAIPWRAEGNEMHEQASFGVLHGDWSPRPAWFAIRDMPK